MKISIITVVRNDKNNIEKTIRSVAIQNHKNKEHIIIDGNSSDGTSDIIKKYSKKLKYFRQSDLGIYDAINKGIKKTNGDIDCLLHSGDIFSNNGILKIINELFKKNYKIVSGNILFYEDKKKLNITRIWNKKIQFLDPKFFFLIPHTTLFIDKKIITKIGPYSLKYKISSDADFTIRLSKLMVQYIHLNKYLIYMKNGGISTNISYLFIKIIEDLKILYNYFNFEFFLIYIKKIFSKTPGLLPKNTAILQKIVKKQLKKIS